MRENWVMCANVERGNNDDAKQRGTLTKEQQVSGGVEDMPLHDDVMCTHTNTYSELIR